MSHVLTVLLLFLGNDAASLRLLVAGVGAQDAALRDALLIFHVGAEVGVDSLVGQVLLFNVYLRDDVRIEV